MESPGPAGPPAGKKMKSRAPPPPGQPPTASKIHSEQKPPTDVEVIPDQNLVNMKENMINRMVDVTVILPTGEEQRNTVQGSKAVMDLLVDLCSRYHLNPAHHTLELKSWESQQPLNYKPNTLIGVLDLQTVLLKEKVPEGKTKRPPPKVPEKSVRLVVNYLKTQKAVVRVSPEVPLHNIIPAICEKCEVSQEHVVLLRDNITGEELELTKSLDELGIKELYAWDRKRETSRNASVSSDAIEKEKRGFLGFFKVNKRSSKGFSTAPNSPSVMSRSITLGPSQSLGNISGMTANPEIKKRRAPPPPTVTPQLQDTERNGQEKTAAQILQGASSQNDLQKKKRRAPPPPTPTPAMPNRTEEKEDKRKSTVESLQLTQEYIYIVDDVVLELSELEETASVSSCFASEDTTDDSGVMSSPSDIVSLDSQNDIVKLRERSANGQVDTAETEIPHAAELYPVRNASCDSNKSGSTHKSRDEMAASKSDNEDDIAARLQQTLVELDDNLGALEAGHYDTDSDSVFNHVNEVLSPRTSNVNTAQVLACSVPVTVIDEIPRVNDFAAPRNKENALLPNEDGIEDFSVDSVNVVDKPPGNSLKVSSELNIASANNNGDLEREEKPNGILLGNVNESDITVQTNIFGLKKKFKPVVQKPVLKDTSLHTALMEAIQTGGGKERLRKISDSMMNGSQQKPSHSEPENEQSALLAAIRGHSGISGLKKISSAASDELRSFKNADVASQNKENSWAEELSIPPPPAQPPPPPPPPVHLSITAAPTFSTTAESNPGEARQALMEAIRSGTGAARLKKVPLLV
ncbi:protein cordon-bleu isoform C [Alligator mississippiensis]|uniref:Protein cordon-bleu isoform C n=1 Tax=Alligator mississippiensis TaxID=8496 RepID=A0A151P1J0_ALLMI|nr:protein cordon-bleu isoform C [Alligator mississippiensis]